MTSNRMMDNPTYPTQPDTRGIRVSGPGDLRKATEEDMSRLREVVKAFERELHKTEINEHGSVTVKVEVTKHTYEHRSTVVKTAIVELYLKQGWRLVNITEAAQPNPPDGPHNSGPEFQYFWTMNLKTPGESWNPGEK